MICGVLTERMSCRSADGVAERFLRNGPDRRTVGEKCRLRVECRGQIVGGTFEAELAQTESKSLIDFIEHASCFRKSVREILPHSGLLRSLPGKEQNDFHQKRMIIEPQVNPAPNATHITVEPSLMVP